MIHFHGTPITPEIDAARILAGRHAMVSFYHPEQIGVVAEVCKSFALDNGAFSAWKSGKPIQDWNAYYAWVATWCRHPGFAFALIPDVIDGDEKANDALLNDWPFGPHVGVPVWHLHESLGRLLRLSHHWPTVALGSSGKFSEVGSRVWWSRMAQAMEVISIEGVPQVRLHGLRMLDPEVFTRLPFASADSTNVARNIGIDQKWRGTYQPPSKMVRGLVMCERIEAFNSVAIWSGIPAQQSGLFDEMPV